MIVHDRDEVKHIRGFPGMLQYGCVTAVLQFSGWQFIHLKFRDILRLHAAKIERLAAADWSSEKSRCGKLVWLTEEVYVVRSKCEHPDGHGMLAFRSDRVQMLRSRPGAHSHRRKSYISAIVKICPY